MADRESSDVVALLHELAATCRDGEAGYRQAAERIADPAVRKQLIVHAQRRAGLGAELIAEIQRLGGDPETTGHLAGALHRGWIGLKSALAGSSDADLLGEVTRGEEFALQEYTAACRRPLPAETRKVLVRQLQDIEAASAEIAALRDRAGAPADQDPRSMS
jgi:uncharacterized protein (TIGR02284 family)